MSSKVDDELDNMLKKHINIVGDGWWHPNYGYSEMKAELLALISEQVREARVREVNDLLLAIGPAASGDELHICEMLEDRIAQLSKKGEK